MKTATKAPSAPRHDDAVCGIDPETSCPTCRADFTGYNPPPARERWASLLHDLPALHAAAGSPLWRADAPAPPVRPKLVAELVGTLLTDPGLAEAAALALLPELVPVVTAAVVRELKGDRR